MMVAGISVLAGFLEWLGSNIEAVAAVLSAVATLFLVGLYRQQSHILQSEQLPHVDIVERAESGDELELQLTNHGNGPGLNLRLLTVLDVPDNSSYEPMEATTRLRHVPEESEPTQQQAISPQSSDISFVGTPTFPIRHKNQPEPCADVSTGVNMLRRQNVDEFVFQVYLLADDKLGGTQAHRVYTFQQYIDLSQIDDSEQPVGLEEARGLGGGLHPRETPDLPEPEFTPGVDSNIL